MTKTKKQYDILSPDGFSIKFEGYYNSIKEALEGLNEWCKRYEIQGYYSSNYGRILLCDLKDECSLITVNN